MRITTVIATSLFVVAAGAGWTNAQALRNAGPPAEFPPASYKGKQYVDSRGCVYIRAGIDGNVTWVPRVNRQRNLLCGFQPSLSPAQLAQARTGPSAGTSGAPVEITLAPEDRRAAPAAPAPVPRAAAPQPSPGPAPTVFGSPAPQTETAPAPRRTETAAAPRAAPSPGPAPTVFGSPPPKAAPAATAQARPAARKPSPAPAPTVLSGAAQPKPKVVRARPAPQPHELAPGTRIVRRHIVENRQNTTNLRVPAGYRAVWTDDRLNPARAERTQAASLATLTPRVPPGYRAAWEDERVSTRRAQGTAQGEAETDAIWTRGAPRVLVPQPSRGHSVRAEVSARNGRSPYWTPPVQAAPPAAGVARVSTRSEPASRPTLATKPRYVRVAVYGTDAQARGVAVALARGGLPMRLGTLTRGGKSYRVVLAGPFGDAQAAQSALSQLHGAGYSGARLGK